MFAAYSVLLTWHGIGGALQAFLEISYGGALLLVLIVTVVYTTVGGFVSVVKTDVVQGVAIRVAAAAMFTLGGPIPALLAIVAFACVTAPLALNPPGGIVKLTTWAGSLFAACFSPAIIFGLHTLRGNGRAVLASYVAGIGVLSAWAASPLAQSLHEVFPAMLASSVAFWAFAMRTNYLAGRDSAAM